MLATHDSLVLASRAFMRFNPYPVFAWPNLPSIGLHTPGLTGFDNASLLGISGGLAFSWTPFSFNIYLFALLQ
jgi:hypothetical protein